MILPFPKALGTPALKVTITDSRMVFPRMSLWKDTGLNGVHGCELRSCTDPVFVDIFNLSLLQIEIPNCFKKVTIIYLSAKWTLKIDTVESTLII